MTRRLTHHQVREGLPADILEELQNAYFRIQTVHGAERVWNRFLKEAQRCQLGNNFAMAYRDGGTVGMWVKLHGVTVERAIIDVAKLLNFIDEPMQGWLLQGTHESSDDPEEALQMVLARAELVLVLEPRAVYRRGSQVEVEWDRHPSTWNYFLKLCEQAKQGRGVDGFDFSEHVKPDNHIKLKSRLTSKTPGFPPELGVLINSQGGGRQRLDLPPQQIRILESLPVCV